MENDMEITENLFPWVPEHACDSHVHILGEPDKYPYMPGNLRFTPTVVLPEDFDALRKTMGTERTVLVQSSIYGKDNSCQLDAAKYLGLANTRVVADIDENTVTDRDLQDLHSRGVRGVRVNVMSTQPLLPGLDQKVLPVIRKLESVIKGTAWFMDIVMPEWLLNTLYHDFENLKVNFCFAHYGMNKACNGTGSGAFQAMLSLMRGGCCWVKLSAPNRISVREDYADAAELGRKIYETAPGRVIWGSDYPHVNAPPADTIRMFQVLKDIAPDAGDMRRIMTDNPAVLFGF